MTEKKSIGNFGERISANYLKKNGYRIIGRNVRCSHKEIDIIAEDKFNLVFVEVKSRLYQTEPNFNIERPGFAVDYQKQNNTLIAAKAYIHSRPFNGKNIRFDVIEVYLGKAKNIFKKYKVYKINHIPNAFDASRR